MTLWGVGGVSKNLQNITWGEGAGLAKMPVTFLIGNFTDTGGMFDNVLFDNSFGFVRQFKNRSFLGSFTVHKKVEIGINQT